MEHGHHTGNIHETLYHREEEEGGQFTAQIIDDSEVGGPLPKVDGALPRDLQTGR